MVKNLPVQENKRHEFDPWVGKIPWRRTWQSTLVFLLGKIPCQARILKWGAIAFSDILLGLYKKHT